MNIVNTDHVSAPSPIEFGGKTYLQSPPTIADLVSLRNYIVAKETESLDNKIASVKSEDLKKALIGKALAELAELEINSPHFNRLMNQRMEYQVYMAFLSFRHTQPDVTLETVEAIYTNVIAKQMEAAKERLLSPMYSPNAETPPEPVAAG